MTHSRARNNKTATGKPRMLQLCAVDFTAYHFLLPLARAASDHFDVEFATAPGPYVDKIRAEGFRYHTIAFERSYNAVAHTRALAQLRTLFGRERYDVVHTHTPIASLLGRISARTSGTPLSLYTAHGFYFHERMSTAKRNLFVGLEKFGGRFTDFTFTQSAEDLESAIQLGIAPRDRILHIGNGVNLDRFNRARFDGQQALIRREIGVDENAQVVCMIGRLVREKGYLELIPAFAEVARRHPRAVLVAVGGALDSDHDAATAAIEAAVREHGLEDRVRFLSFQQEPERILAAADLFVLPSHREGFPRSLIEAMAMGLASVVTNIRGSREAIEDGVTGRIVEVGDIAALAGSIDALLNDDVARARMASQAQTVARERFDESAVIGRQLDVIGRLCRERGVIAG